MLIPEGETSVNFVCTRKASWFGIELIECSCIWNDIKISVNVSILKSQFFLFKVPSLGCDIPEAIENGYFIYNQRSIGSSVTYKCNMNFVLVGNLTRVCQRNLKWSDSKPSCLGTRLKFCYIDIKLEIYNRHLYVAYKCPPLETFTKGRMEFDDYSVFYSCDQGYELIGSAERICLTNLQWSGQAPKCSRKID